MAAKVQAFSLGRVRCCRPDKSSTPDGRTTIKVRNQLTQRSGSTLRYSVCFWLLLALLGTAALTLFAFSLRKERAASHCRSVQIALVELNRRTQEIHTLEWQAIDSEELSPESSRHLAIARTEVGETLHVLQPAMSTFTSRSQLTSSTSDFLRYADEQLQLASKGRFENARRFDFDVITPQFDILQTVEHQVIEEQERLIQSDTLRSRVALACAVFLVSIVVLLMVLRAWRQKDVLLASQTVLRNSERRFRSLLEKSSDVIFITDASFDVFYASPSITTTLGRGDEYYVGKNMRDLVHPDEREKIQAIRLDNGGNHTLEFRAQHADSRWLYFDCAVRNLLSQENIHGVVFNAREVTEKKNAQTQLQHNATHDQLTGLPNRSSFLSRLDAVISRLKRHPDAMAAVLFLDLDDFKIVNDCLGHAAGDELIIEVAKRVKGCLRKDGVVARLGGDEFTVLLEEVSDPSDALRVAQRMHAVLAEPFTLSGQEIFKDASIGIAIASGETSAESLMQNADLAMYRAKSRGKGCSELFDSAMHAQVMNRLTMEATLRKSLEANQLMLHYQPIVMAASGALEGFEALVRWQLADGEFIPPNVFIPIAEQCGLIIPLGNWIMRTACQKAEEWNRRYSSAAPLYVSINVSARQLAHPSFIKEVADAVQQTGVKPECIRLELTESVAMKDAPGTVQAMAQLRALGVKLSIDDFGTGYSSLSYLRRFPVDVLKIDQSFVADMESNSENYAIVKSVIALARSLGMEVVAEGVETSDQLERLKFVDCDFAQGYLFSRPLPSDAVEKYIESSFVRRAHQRSQGEFGHVFDAGCERPQPQ